MAHYPAMSDELKVLVVGAGALGTCYAVLLARAGADVSVLANPARPERKPALEQGLRVGGLVEATARVRVVTSGREAAALRAAGFPTWSVPDIRAVEWYKLCLVLPGAFVTALSRRTYAEMALDGQHLAPLWVRLMREVCSVAQAEGVTPTDPPASPWRLGTWQHEPDEVVLGELRGIGERQRAAGERMLPSMAQDVLARRRTEAEDLAGDLLRRARRLGVAIPATETCYAL